MRCPPQLHCRELGRVHRQCRLFAVPVPRNFGYYRQLPEGVPPLSSFFPRLFFSSCQCLFGAVCPPLFARVLIFVPFDHGYFLIICQRHKVDGQICARVVRQTEHVWARTLGVDAQTLFKGLPLAMQSDLFATVYQVRGGISSFWRGDGGGGGGGFPPHLRKFIKKKKKH